MKTAADSLQLSYLNGGVAQYRAGEHLGPRLLHDHELVLIIEGNNVVYVADGREYAAPAGSLLFTRPGFREMYRWDPAGPTRHAYFHFGVLSVPERWPKLSSWPVIRNRPAPVLVSLFRHVVDRIYLHQDWPATAPGRIDCLVVETLLSLFLEGSEELADPERDRPIQVNRAIHLMREVIDTDPHRRLTLRELAERGGVSDKHLCRSFHKSLGHPPVRTYRLLCMQLGLSLLVRSNLNIEEIADRCGFDDPAYFSRYFSKVFGCSPSRVRQRLGQGMPPPAGPLPGDITPLIFW